MGLVLAILAFVGCLGLGALFIAFAGRGWTIWDLPDDVRTWRRKREIRRREKELGHPLPEFERLKILHNLDDAGNPRD